MKFIKDAKQCWRWFSVQALTAIAVLPVVWINLPTDAKAMIPDAAEPWAFTVLAVAGVVGRLVNQGGE